MYSGVGGYCRWVCDAGLICEWIEGLLSSSPLRGRRKDREMASRSRKDRKKRKNVTLATRLYFPRKDEGRESGCLDSFITSLCFLERMKEMNDRRWKEEAMGIYNISECLRLFVVPLNTLSPNPPLPLLSFTFPHRYGSNVHR